MKKRKIFNTIVLSLSILIISGCGSKMDNSTSNIIGLQVHKSELPSIKQKKLKGLRMPKDMGMVYILAKASAYMT
ncbi:hypothetical protein [Butyrivibrio sp. VCD2006]|uniref:hypothetical protein n=1 Tax=Butyrivibrio sp. VCD2006 TaxID=1280664 RepID=UPI00047B7E3B|nr:hypothetical protein [Butyrivibrio sp. VCD2006]